MQRKRKHEDRTQKERWLREAPTRGGLIKFSPLRRVGQSPKTLSAAGRTDMQIVKNQSRRNACRRKEKMKKTGIYLGSCQVIIMDNGLLALSSGTEMTDFPDARGTHPMNWHQAGRHTTHGCPYCYAGRHPERIKKIVETLGGD